MKGFNNFPPTLPANIYSSATGRPAASPLVRNSTLHVNSPPPIPMRSPVFKGRTLTPLIITPEEYQKYQTFFKQLDTDHSGFVSGADAVVFFRHSKLPESELAKIWDLADTNSSGMLSEQEFAMAMHMINRRVTGGDLPNSLPTFNIQPPQQQQQNVDLLGLSSDFSSTSESTNTTAVPPFQQNNVNLARSQSTLLQSNISTESNRLQNAQQQFNVESQAVQELLKQIQNQKEVLNKMKSEADEGERLLKQEQKRKEELTQELQLLRQETKHFSSRAENAKEETKRVKSEIEDLEKSKASENKQDFFSLSTVTSPAVRGGELFAKVNEDTAPSTGLFSKVNDSNNTSTSPLFSKVNDASPVSNHSTGQKTFDPFAGFKSNVTAQPTPSPTINSLKKEENTKSSSTPSSSHIDISDIESKFPDLSTMEQNFPPAAPAEESPKKTQTPPAKNASVSKYGFDLSAFESSNPNHNNNATSDKDELTSLFGSPSPSDAQLPNSNHGSGFDAIFGQATTTNTKNTNFEDIFNQK